MGWLGRAAVFGFASACTVRFGDLKSDAAHDAGPVDSGVADAPPSDAPSSVSEGLIAWWTFDEGSGDLVKDRSGRGHDGRATSGTRWVAGHVAGAMEFDGVSSVEVPPATDFSLQDRLTAAMWVRLEVVTYDQHVLSSQYAWAIELNRRYPQFQTNDNWATSNRELASGEWHHIAFTFDRGSVTLYFDGVSTPTSNNFPDGAALPTPGNKMLLCPDCKGSLDEVRLYDRVLSPAEIVALAET